MLESDLQQHQQDAVHLALKQFLLIHEHQEEFLLLAQLIQEEVEQLLDIAQIQEDHILALIQQEVLTPLPEEVLMALLQQELVMDLKADSIRTEVHTRIQEDLCPLKIIAQQDVPLLQAIILTPEELTLQAITKPEWQPDLLTIQQVNHQEGAQVIQEDQLPALRIRK